MMALCSSNAVDLIGAHVIYRQTTSPLNRSIRYM